MASRNPSVREFLEAMAQHTRGWGPAGNTEREPVGYRVPEGDLVARMHPAAWRMLLRDPALARPWSPVPMGAYGTPVGLFGIDMHEGPELPEGGWNLIRRSTGQIRATGTITDVEDPPEPELESGYMTRAQIASMYGIPAAMLGGADRRVAWTPPVHVGDYLPGQVVMSGEQEPDPPSMAECALHDWACRMDSVCPMYQQCTVLDRSET